MNTVRVRISAPDPFAGLTGRDYLRARGLRPQVGPMAAPRMAEDCPCPACVQARLLPAVLRIIDGWALPATKNGTKVVPIKRRK